MFPLKSCLKYVVLGWMVVAPVSWCMEMDIREDEPIDESPLQITAIYNIKGTYDVIEDNYKHLSLIFGAIVWESGFIRRLYDFGDITPLWKTEKKGERERTVIAGYKPGGDAMTLLVHSLFYRVPGSIGAMDFGVTKQLKRLPLNLWVEAIKSGSLKNAEKALHKNIISNIADMLACLTQARACVPEILSIMTEIGSCDSRLTQDNVIILRKPDVRIRAIEALPETVDPVNKDKISQSIRTIIKQYLPTINRFFIPLEQFSRDLKSILHVAACKSLKENNKDKTLEVLTHALIQSDPHNPQALYAPYMTEMVLLSFVYKKFGNDKALIKFFYERLNRKFEYMFFKPHRHFMPGQYAHLTDQELIHILGQTRRGKILRNRLCVLPSSWVKDNYQPIKPAEAKQAIEEIFKKANINRHYEDLVFYSTQLASYPTPNGYQEVFFKQGTFPDCMDNSIRNFIRLLFYNHETQKFDVNVFKKYREHKTKLLERGGLVPYEEEVVLKKRKRKKLQPEYLPEKAQKKVKHTDLNYKLLAFLKKYNSPKYDESSVAHQEWLNVISDIPYVFYRSAILNSTLVRISEKDPQVDVFFQCPLSQVNVFNESFMDPVKIKLISHSGCEIKANIHNLIVILDYLLGLGLFEKEPLVKAILRSDFIKVYFPKLCQELGCQGYISTQPHTNDEEDIITFDAPNAQDLQQKLYTNLKFPTFTCQFATAPIHGELSLSGDMQLPSISLENHSFNSHPMLELCVAHLVNKTKIDEINFIEPARLYNACFGLPLENTSLTNELIDQIDWTDVLPAHLDRLAKLLFRIVDKQPDPTLKEIMRLGVWYTLIKKDYEIGYARALQEALDAFTQNTNDIFEASLNVLKKLFDKNYQPAYEKAAQVAQEAFFDDYQDSVNDAMVLFKELFEKKQGFVCGLETAQKAIDDKKLIAEGFNLFEELVEAEVAQAYSPALERALSVYKQCMNDAEEAYQQVEESQRRNIRNQILHIESTIASILRLFAAFVEKGYLQAYEPALSTLQSAFCSVFHFDEPIIMIISAFLQHTNYKRAEVVAGHLMRQPTTRAIMKLKIANELVRAGKELYYIEALNLAQDAFLQNSSEIINEATAIFESLVITCKQPTLAIMVKLIKTFASHMSQSYKVTALLKLLIAAHDAQTIPFAISFASKLCLSHDPAGGYELFQALFDINKGCDEAIKVAVDMFKNTHLLPRAIDFFENILMQSVVTRAKALEALQALTNHNDTDISKAAQEILARHT